MPKNRTMRVYTYECHAEKSAFLEIQDQQLIIGGQERSLIDFLRFPNGSLADLWPKAKILITRRKGDFIPDLETVYPGNTPAFSERAWECLRPLIGNDVEALPLNSTEGKFYIINVLRHLECVDFEKSLVEHMKNGEILCVKEYIFLPGFEPSSHIFLPAGVTCGDILITEVFIKTCEEHGLKGLTPGKVLGKLSEVKSYEESLSPVNQTPQPIQYLQVDLAGLVTYEQSLPGPLPEDYRKYLLEFNGQMPGGSDVRGIYSPEEDRCIGEVSGLYGIHDGELEEALAFYKENMPKGMIPIGSDVGGNQICLCLTGPNRNRIYIYDHEAESEPADMTNFDFIANNFTDFIQLLRPVTE
jgi:hypothetical protein